MDEYYEVNWDPWVNYQVFDSNGALVEISRPEAVTLTCLMKLPLVQMLVEKRLLNTEVLEGCGDLNGLILTLQHGQN